MPNDPPPLDRTAQVAVLLPTLNAEPDLERLLPALRGQTLWDNAEFIAVDSSSDDGTVAILRQAGFLVESIRRSEFGHGLTRNRLAELSSAEFLVFLSQDATPTTDAFLESMLRPFSDPTIGGVIARVLPGPGDDPLTVRTVMSSPEASDQPSTKRWSDPEAYASMSGKERAELLRFNNVASCIRREAFEAIPFPEVPFGEDFAWAARAMAAGWGIHFEPTAVVHHAHRYGPLAALRRYRTDAVFHREFYGARVRPNLLTVVKGSLYEVKEDMKHLVGLFRRKGFRARGILRSLLMSPALRVAQTYGQYLGSVGRGSAAVDIAAWDAARERGELDVPFGAESPVPSS